MQIVLNNLSRSFGSQRVIDSLTFQFEEGESYAVLGGNGSGKSTLLKMIYGALTPSSGSIKHYHQNEEIKADNLPFQISLAGPYLELIEELSASEFLSFYNKFREFKVGFTANEILAYCNLSDSAHKEIRNFSSGMKQRLRLGLALFSTSKLILLDEPTSNLDPSGMEWYATLIEEHRDGRTIIVGSNYDEREMGFCNSRLNVRP